MIHQNEPVKLSRDCNVVLVPSGTKMILPAGTVVQITQSLGGDYTIMTNMGYMARIDGKDGDAIGKPVVSPLTEDIAAGMPLEKMVWKQLKTCFDPEIPVNIVDLGLVYECKLTPVPEGGNSAEIKMTLTAPGCGMGHVLKADVERKVSAIPGISSVNAEVIFEPPWNQTMMTEAARLQLGMM